MRTTLTTVTATILASLLVSGTAFAADPSPKDKPSQQSKMKICNAEAKAKAVKGAERRAFMSECLKAQ